jgi:hypothetical protein
MSNAGIHDDIEALEARIEQLAETAEGCRKWILLSKVAMAIGAILLVARIADLIWYDLSMTLFAIALVLGGIVLGGSNFSTLRRTEAERRAADELRTRIIDAADLPSIGAP